MVNPVGNNLVQSKPFDPSSLVRPAVRATPAYIPSKPPERYPGRLIRLDMNESPYGPSPKARKALAEFTDTHRYPDFPQWALREALGAYVGKPADQIVCGAGSDDVLMTFSHALLDARDEVIISEPTFGVYRDLVSLCGGVTVNVPLGSGFSLDADRILDAVTNRTKFIMICTPNNPTGNDHDPAAIKLIVENAPCFVAIDEAYAEFSSASYLDFIDLYPNAVVFRTMSKFAGLAGMRVGYGIFPRDLMPFMETVTPPFHNVSLASRAAAISSLDDLPYLKLVVATISASRNALAEQLREIPGVQPFPSSTNFVLVRLPVQNAKWVVDELAQRGVLVRHFNSDDLGIRDCLRVTVGSQEENEIFLRELSDILSKVEALV
jgi:histidinol-phosphate aminotransferase